MPEKKYQVEVKKLDHSEVEIIGEIPSESFSSYRPKVIKNLQKEAELDGFRKGHVPEDVLLKHLGDERLLQEMAQEAIASAYSTIITENEIDAIGRPAITITKLAAGNPLGFIIKTAVVPTIKLPDYKKIASGIMAEEFKPETVSDEEVEKVIAEIRRARKKPETETKPGTEETLPELTDEEAKTLGTFESAAELRLKLKDNLAKEKLERALEKRRLAVMDKVIAESTIDLPPVLIDSELDKMLSEMRGEIERMGLRFDDYLIHLKKTVDELKTGWRGDAEKRVRFGLILDEIANLEKLEGAPEEIEHEVKHLLEHYPEANPVSVRNYVSAMLRHNQVFTFFEKQK